jgi:tripartite-type tricarboxylate transporter receptor subunit TctC
MIRHILGFTGIALLATLAHAQSGNYPSRPVRVIVPSSPGGIIDVVTRMLAPKWTEGLGQAVVIDNRAGASTNLGSELVARAPADGYTLLSTTVTLVVNPSVFTKMPFSVEKDLAPVSLLTSAPYAVVVHPSLPVRSIRELVVLARAKPMAVNYASGGNGTNFHMAIELLSNLAGIRMTHVPYKGGGPALASVVGGETSLTIPSLATALPQVHAGRLRALAITSAQRSPLAPDLPTVAESGLPGYTFAAWVGVLAPAATPADIVAALNGHIVKALRSPELAARFAADGTQVVASTPAEFGALIRSELPRWAKVVKESGIHAE